MYFNFAFTVVCTLLVTGQSSEFSDIFREEIFVDRTGAQLEVITKVKIRPIRKNDGLVTRVYNLTLFYSPIGKELTTEGKIMEVS